MVSRAYLVGIARTQIAAPAAHKSVITPAFLDINWGIIDDLNYIDKKVRNILTRKPGQIYVLLHILSNPEDVRIITKPEQTRIITREVYKLNQGGGLIDIETVLEKGHQLIVAWADGGTPTMILNFHSHLTILTMKKLIIHKSMPRNLRN